MERSICCWTERAISAAIPRQQACWMRGPAGSRGTYYTLQASDGGGYSLLRVDGGILLFDAGDNTLTQYEKRDNALFFASIPGPWPEWCGL